MAEAYPEWRRLNEILAVINAQGIGALEAEEIVAFGKLYRRAAAELSFHRTHEADPARLAYLNDLVGRCYAHVYVAPRRPWPSVIRFFTTEYPRAIRRHLLWIMLAVIISLVPAGIGYWLTRHDRAIADQVLPAQLMEGLDYLAQRHHTPRDWMPLKKRPEMAGFLMTHNTGIAITAFAGGMTCGVVTIYIMITNGLMLGVVAAAVQADGFATARNFWAFVAPHGVFELTAIFISGGAGLLLAYAILNPGSLPRHVALREAGKEALKLMLGVAAMLVVAGCLEAFFSPVSSVQEGVKLGVAGGEFLLLWIYLLFAGRRRLPGDDAVETPFGRLMSPLPPV